jgi:hypothetical protein
LRGFTDKQTKEGQAMTDVLCGWETIVAIAAVIVFGLLVLATMSD